jgi:2-polyprenyl-3-methyl-5-hydroxy-6-metoxy-1,4-benzoquinol methylase
MTVATAFDKYDAQGAYHWIECDRRYGNWKRYNPALDARYAITVRTILNLRLRGDLLDVGCGDGMLMARLAPIMDRVVGVDSEDAAIRLAKEKLREFSSCELLHTASSDLPFAENMFDVVTSADVIEHLKEPARHLREIGRVLKTEGTLVLTTPKWRPDRKWDVRHEKEYRPEELRALLERHFEKIELLFFWPMKWSRFYATKLGWRLLKLLAIQLHNPFLHTSSEPESFGQILAVCRRPRRERIRETTLAV